MMTNEIIADVARKIEFVMVTLPNDKKKFNFMRASNRLLSQKDPEFWTGLFGEVYISVGFVPWDHISRAVSSIICGSDGAYSHPKYVHGKPMLVH